MNAHAEMTSAATETARIVAGVAPGQLADPTPCADWDVRALLNEVPL